MDRMARWDGGCEGGETEQQIAGLATEIAPSSKQGKRTRPSSRTGARRLGSWCASAAALGALLPSHGGRPAERESRKEEKEVCLLIGGAAGDGCPWPKTRRWTCAASLQGRREEVLFSAGRRREKNRGLQWCCSGAAGVGPALVDDNHEPFHSADQPPCNTEPALPGPHDTTHALGHDPCHQGSSCTTPPDPPFLIIRPAAHCPHSWEARNRSLLGMFT
ncbi:hypothetical protein QBC39DRAFT_169735 [Podospora conica]|nr:hypothetical protein QBC39DRAFT_169735 [Schizothecium conicum]